MEPSAAPPRRDSGRLRMVLALVIFAAVLVVAFSVAYLFLPPPTPAQPPPGAPVEFSRPWTSGNSTAGWTYTVNVTVVPGWESPRPIAWGDLHIRVDLAGNTTYGLYPYPPGTTLHVTDASNTTIAVENLTAGVWQDGLSVLIETGQHLVLRGKIAPGTTYVHGTVMTGFVGPTIVIEYANAGGPVGWLLPIQGPWVYY